MCRHRGIACRLSVRLSTSSWPHSCSIIPGYLPCKLDLYSTSWDWYLPQLSGVPLASWAPTLQLLLVVRVYEYRTLDPPTFASVRETLPLPIPDGNSHCQPRHQLPKGYVHFHVPRQHLPPCIYLSTALRYLGGAW